MPATTYYNEMGKLLQLWGISDFTAHELAPVGRRQGQVVLKAPPTDLLQQMLPTIVRLQCIRRRLGSRIRVLSGYRDLDYNQAVGGSRNSLHMSFNALDLVPLDKPLEDLYQALLLLPGADLHFGLGLYPQKNFLHFDTRVLIGDRPWPWHEVVQ
jgi:uncharacterized protein YcbK (DUF882 family)